MPAVPSTPIVPKDGTILLNDNTGTPLAHTVMYEDGEFKVTNLKKGQYAVQAFKDRGVVYAVREIEVEEIEFTFSCHIVGFVGEGAQATVNDPVLKKGLWASAVSMLPVAYGDAYLLKVTWTVERTNFDSAADGTLVLKYCHLDMDGGEGVPGKWEIKGTAYVLAHDVAASVAWT